MEIASLAITTFMQRRGVCNVCVWRHKRNMLACVDACRVASAQLPTTLKSA